MAKVNLTKILEIPIFSDLWYMYMGSDSEPLCNEDV